ncbi:MAG: mandelate racemase/muconate lactonizing enzyme family protein [Tannerella sp.]|jgi:L-alanine-DL-glutamate epimerase-like enolase superfamily enzyme|nr:mandelate racemase/muconate lactonizing enzyme family protein [Tannerella sp.]
MKTTNRRQFITSAVAGGMALSGLPLMSFRASGSKSSFSEDELKSRFDQLDHVLKQPVLKKKLFPEPVMIESLELLQYNNSYLCRVRSKDGAEGLSVAHPDIVVFAPIFTRRLRSFFIGQDARELDLMLETVIRYNLNYRLEGMALGLPLATIEFAILDMLGKIAGKPVAQLIGEIHNPYVGLYMATEFRELPLEEHFARIREEVARYDVNALKIKVGFMWGGNRDIHYRGIPGKSEKLIPMVREFYGKNMALYADANGYYDVADAIRIGRMLEENNYAYFEEPVMFNYFEDIKKLSDELTIPIANGEQDQGFYNFRWLLAHDGIDIVQPDTYYFGGFIRSMKVALMAQIFGKTCVPHMSGGGLGFLYNAVFVSALPNADPHHEFKSFDTNVVYECPTAPPKVENGKMKAPTGPGMGVVIDPEFVAKHEAVVR